MLKYFIFLIVNFDKYIKFKLKNIIITGTSRGIGYALVKCFAEKNHRVLAITRNKKSLSDLQKKYSNLTVLPIEITKREGIEDIEKYVTENCSGVVHNLATDEQDACRCIRHYLSHLPQNAWQAAPSKNR